MAHVNPSLDLQAIEAREDRCLGCLIHLEGLPEVVQHAYAAFGDRTALLAEVKRLSEENDMFRHVNGEWATKCANILAEKESLREALESLLRKFVTLARGAGNSRRDIEEATAASRAALLAYGTKVAT